MKNNLIASFWIFLFSITLLISCKKINEATTLGGDIVPDVDNINTFETFLDVNTFNGIFDPNLDTIRTDELDLHYAGNINNDPLFGKTEAAFYMQLAPSFYKYFFPFKQDSLIQLDSVVLVLSYRDIYGDSTKAQSFNVFEINQASNFRGDSNYWVTKNDYITLGPQLGPTKTFTPTQLNDSVFLFREKSINQLRIKLDNSFGARMLAYDSTNAYASDSALKTYFKGFAVVPQNNGVANALLGFQLTDTNTKLALYYRYKNTTVDTAVTYFRLNFASATGNFVKRDYAGSQVATYADLSTSQDDLAFVQTSPGTFVDIRIPGLDTMSNKIVHRAELIAEQVWDVNANIFPPPSFLFLDAYDSVKQKFRTIPYDLLFGQGGELNVDQFGMRGKKTLDGGGNPISVWRFNISRYVQRVLNNTEPNYKLRLVAPFSVREIYRTGFQTDIEQIFNLNPTIAKGRVRLGGGNHPTQPMRLRIVYSKI